MLAAALVLAVQSSTASATVMPYPIGRADFGQSSGGVSGTAFVRNYVSGETHVQLRLTGLTPGRPDVWRMQTNSPCSGTTGTALITPKQELVPSSLGIGYMAATYPTTVPVGPSPIWIAIRIYASVGPNGTLGPQLACGNLYSLPDDMSSRHSW
jgi:hypothetical protein